MTKPPRRKPAKAGAMKVSAAVRQSPATANAVVSTPRRQSTARAGARELTALVERVVAIIENARARVVRTVNSEKDRVAKESIAEMNIGAVNGDRSSPQISLLAGPSGS
jgi:hypothetical protein